MREVFSPMWRKSPSGVASSRHVGSGPAGIKAITSDSEG
jgi:hypothetical protein